MSYPTRTVINNSLDIEIPVVVPTTLAGFLEIAKEADLINAILRHSFYQKFNNKFRKSFVEALAKFTGIARRAKTNKAGQTIERKNRAGEMVAELETEANYIDFLRDDKHISDEDYFRLGLEIGAAIPFEVTKAEEEKEPSKEFMAAAGSILGKVEAGLTGADGQIATQEGFIEKFTSIVPEGNLENLGGWTKLGVARALELMQERMLAQAY